MAQINHITMFIDDFCDSRIQEELIWGLQLGPPLHCSQNLTVAIVFWKFNWTDVQNISLLWLAVDAGSRLRTQLGLPPRACPCVSCTWLEVFLILELGFWGSWEAVATSKHSSDPCKSCTPPSHAASHSTTSVPSVGSKSEWPTQVQGEGNRP